MRNEITPLSKEYKATAGFKDVLVLTREIGDVTEYILITLRDSMEAVRRFGGPEPERALLAALSPTCN